MKMKKIISIYIYIYLIGSHLCWDVVSFPFFLFSFFGKGGIKSTEMRLRKSAAVSYFHPRPRQLSVLLWQGSNDLKDTGGQGYLNRYLRVE